METPTATKGKFVVLDMGPKSVRAAAFTQSDTKFSCTETTVYEGDLPLELDSLLPGRYHAVAEKEGWSSIEMDVAVLPKAISTHRMDFPLASVRLTSQPAGAKVHHGLTELGNTPLTLEGLPPGEHLFSLELAGYEPMEVNLKLDPDTLLEPPAIELLSWDRIVPGGQVHTLPAILEQTNPVPPVRNREEVRVVVRAIVNVDGPLSDLTVVSSDNNNFNNAALRALANWRFEPATRHDRPVRTQINIPLVFPAF